MKNKMSVLTRINAALKAGGRGERLVRGRGYYYLTRGSILPGEFLRATSIYVFWLEPTEADYQFAVAEVNDLFKNSDIDFRIPTTKKGK